MRQADELSITTQPLAPILGEYSFDAAPHETNVGIGKVVVLERLDLERLLAERDLAPDRGGRSERDNLGDGETALGEDCKHLAADIPCGAGDRDLEA